MKRCFYLVTAFIVGVIVSCCLLATKANAADTITVHLDNNPVGRLLSGSVDTTTGYTPYDLLRASMYDDISASMDEIVRTTTWDALTDPLGSLGNYSFDIKASSWYKFLKENWTSTYLGSYKYLIFAVDGTVFSLPTGNTNYGLGGESLDVVIRCAFLECFTPYTVCLYSPMAVSDVDSDLTDLRGLSLGKLTQDNAFLDYIVHPLVGILPIEGNFDVTSVYLKYAKTADYYTPLEKHLEETISHPLQMPDMFASSVANTFTGSYDYRAWLLMHGARENDVYVPVDVSEDLLPNKPFSLVVQSGTARPFTYMNMLVPVAYVTRWAPTSEYGVYSMMNRVYEKTGIDEDGKTIVTSVAVTPGTSTLSYFSVETRNGCVGRVTPTYVDGKDVSFNLNYLEIYEDGDAGVSEAYTLLGMRLGATGFAVDTVHVYIRPQMRSIVYINIQDGYYYRVNSGIALWQEMTADKLGMQGIHIVDSKGDRITSALENMTVEDLFKDDSEYHFVDADGNRISKETLLETLLDSGTVTRALRNYAQAGSKTPFGSDIVFDYERLSKADGSFKFLLVKSCPTYRAFFSETDSSDNGTARVSYLYGVDSDYKTWQFTPVREERHLVALPTSVYECMPVTDKVTNINSLGATYTTVITTYVETGRQLNIDYTGAKAIDMTLAGQAFQYSNNNTVQAQGVFYNQLGKIVLSRDPELNLLEHKMMFFGNSGHPTITLSPSYVEQSGLLVWLQTSDAAQFMTQYTKRAGYSANTLYTRVTTSGVDFGFGVSTGDDIDRLLEIEDELADRKEATLHSAIFTAISMVGILMIAYAACLVVAYYLDIFNTFASFSILNIITLGGCRAIHTKQELVDMGVTDPKQQRKYVTLSGILIRWTVCTLFGILLFCSNQVFIWVMMLYEKLMAFFGL